MKLYYTPRSHFSRKVRILIDAYELDVELVDAGDVADGLPEKFGANPLMKVPTLHDNGCSVFDSDGISQYLVEKVDADDRFDVLATDVNTLNARAVMNGAMSAEVELILAARTGIPVEAYRRFGKLRDSIQTGLAWLEAHVDFSVSQPSYAGFHLVCLWDHLDLCDMVPLEYPKLRRCVERLSDLTFVAQSAPA